MTLEQLAIILQLSIGPTIIISGVGLLLLSMTNRYGRVIDRIRYLAKSMLLDGELSAKYNFTHQLQFLSRRANILRLAIIFASFSLLCAALLMLSLFMIDLLALSAFLLIIILFGLCLISLIISLVIFMIDIQISLKAINIIINSCKE